ncbi:MAG: T9SS type A sorting domain-containing protein [Candidatus Latescibacterota bacterium]|nr:T9SS type A sorting domain-containing protein [Candidatus Latescibacterota bacterium]
MAIGEILTVEIHADAQGLELTSASAYISFDEAIFALVPVPDASVGIVQPFESGPFLPGQIYENSTAGDAEGGNGLEGFQLNFVAVSGAGEHRSTGRGQGVLARFKLRAVGYPATGASALRLDRSGQRQPRYTTLDAPGVERRFDIEPVLWVDVEGEGLIPLADRALTAGERQNIDLELHYISQKWSREEIVWEVWSAAPERLQVEVTAGQLGLQAIAEDGVVAVFYRATIPSGQIVEGVFAVELNAAPKQLAAMELEVVEDGGTQRLSLAELLRGEGPEGVWHWSVQGTGAVAAEIAGEEILFESEANWHGSETLVVTLCDAVDRCETTTLTIRVAPVNDPPQIASLNSFAVAVGQRRRGPVLAEIIADPDHALAELQIAIEGDAFAAAAVVDGALEIRGVAVGSGQVLLRVVDPLGAQVSSAFNVQVVPRTASPQFDALSDVDIEMERSYEIFLGIADADTPWQELQWTIAVEGPIVAAVLVGEMPQLQLRGLAPGAAMVRLQVRDLQGNEATMALRVEVREQVAIPEVPATATEAEPPDPEIAPAAPVVDDDLGIPDGPTGSDAGSQPENIEVELPVPPADVVTANGEMVDDPMVEMAPTSDVPALQLADIPDLHLTAGSTGEFSLAEYVVAGAAPDLQWSVAGATELEVAIDAAGRVVVRVPADFSGREVLLFQVEDAEGQVVVDAVRVLIPAQETTGEPVALPEELSDRLDLGADATMPEPTNTPVLELNTWPEIELVAGRVDSALVLDQLVATGDPQAVVWTLRGGVFIAARIDAQRRLYLDGSQALQGREIFFLEAQLEVVRQQVKIVVRVQAPAFGLKPLPEMRLEVGAGELDLGDYVEGDFTPGEIAWEVRAPTGISAGFTGTTLWIEGATAGLFALALKATSPTGQQLAAVLEVEIMEVVVVAADEDLSAETIIPGEEEPIIPIPAEPVAESPLPEGAERVMVDPGESIPIDNRAPNLSLSGHLLSDDAVEFHLVTDEALGGMPVMIADGRVLPVAARADYYIASYGGAAGSIQVLAAASDLAGNAAETQLALSAGRGPGVLSPDGRVRVQGRLGAVLLYAEEAGYRVELVAGSLAELVFSVVAPGQGLFRRTERGWEEVPAQTTGDELYAVVVEGGLYRLAKGAAAIAPPTPVAYPNPFNSEVVLRYLVGAEGAVRVVVYDVLGAQIRLLANQIQGAGMQTLIWDGRDQWGMPAASGVYLLSIEVGGESRSRKVVLIR